MEEVISDIKKRIIILNGYIEEENAGIIIHALKMMEIEDYDRDISFYINSNGGTDDEFFAIYDVMRTLNPKVNTIGMGVNASAGAFILMSGTGKRTAYKNSRVMIHNLSSWNKGSFEDMDIYHKELIKVKEKIEEITVFHTGQPIDKVREDLKRDIWMSADEALEYGIVDEVI